MSEMAQQMFNIHLVLIAAKHFLGLMKLGLPECFVEFLANPTKYELVQKEEELDVVEEEDETEDLPQFPRM